MISVSVVWWLLVNWMVNLCLLTMLLREAPHIIVKKQLPPSRTLLRLVIFTFLGAEILMVCWAYKLLLKSIR